jgi:small subunit ribosomal protein S3
MGQKINPRGLRLNITRTWESNWFAEGQKYSDFLIEDLRIRNHIYTKILRRKGFDKVEISDIRIKRFPDSVNVYIYTSRPGVLIGKKGSDIELLKNDIKKFVDPSKTVNLNISEVKKVDLDSRVVAQSVGKMIEGRMNYKKSMKQALARCIKSGAKGAKIQISGRLGGSDIARREYFKEGSIPLHTFSADIDFGQYQAITTYGTIGVTVWINRGLIERNRKDLNEELGSLVTKGA